MSHVYVKIKDEKHARKVIKLLRKIGYEQKGSTAYSIGGVKAICVFNDGDYQLLKLPYYPDMIKPKELMTSEPVLSFLENKYV